MSIVRKIAFNSSIVIIGRLSELLLRLVPVILMARYLGSEGYGEYSYILAYIAIFIVLMRFGIDNIIIREISKDHQKVETLIGNGITLKLFISAIGILLSIIIAKFSGLSETKITGIILVSFLLPFEALKSTLSSYYNAFLKMKYVMLATFIGSASFAIGVLLIVFIIKGSIAHFLIIYIISYAIPFFIIYSFSIKHYKIKYGFDKSIYKYLFLSALPLGCFNLLNILNEKIGILILEKLHGDIAVGFFSAPSTITTKLSLIPWALMLSLFPLFSSYYENNRKKWEFGFNLSLKYILIIFLFLTVITELFSKEIIVLTFGNKFEVSAFILPILVLALLFFSYNMLLVNIIVSAGEQKILVSFMTVSLIFNIFFNLLLSPGLSYLGTSYAFLISNSIFTILGFYYMHRKFNITLDFFGNFKIIISAILLFLILTGIGAGPWIALIFGSLIYLIFLYMIGIIGKTDFEILKKIKEK